VIPPRAVAVAVALASAASLVACGGGSSVPLPARGPHVSGDPVPVPFPPPAARPDVIGAPPPEAKDPVWVDGQWLWRGRQWIWQPGQWWERPVGQVYAAPALVRLPDGQLVWFEGRWRAAEGLPAPGAPAQDAAR
jgi:hypothetical protein